MSKRTYAERVIADGATNYWRLEETGGLTFADAVSGNTATVPASTGLIYGVASLADGSKGLATAAAHGLISFAPVVLGTTCTFECWFRPAFFDGGYTALITNTSGGAGLYCKDGKLNFNCGAGGDKQNTTPLVLSRSYHCVVAITAGAGTFYLDGIPDGTFTGWPGATLASLAGTGTPSRVELLDECAIYPYALTPAQILAHYQLGVGTYVTPPQPPVGTVGGSKYAQRVVSDGATNYWRLDEASGQALDSVGGAHGTVIGGVTRGVPGPLRDPTTAVQFNGVDAKILFPAPVVVPLVCTIEGWIRSFCLTSSEQMFFVTRTLAGAVGDGIAVGITGPAGGARLRASAPAGVLGTAVVPHGAWAHVAFVGNSTTCSLFLNGVLDATGAWPRVAPSSGPAQLGFDPGVFAWTGEMDEVALYATALTPAQIAAHYQLGVGTFADTPSKGSPAAPSVDRALLVGAIAAPTVSPAIDVAGVANFAFTVVGNGSVTAGAVTLEEAHDIDYAGAWAPLVAPVTVVPGATFVQPIGTAKAVRARVTTAIVGGSASVVLVAR